MEMVHDFNRTQEENALIESRLLALKEEYEKPKMSKEQYEKMMDTMEEAKRMDRSAQFAAIEALKKVAEVFEED